MKSLKCGNLRRQQADGGSQSSALKVKIGAKPARRAAHKTEVDALALLQLLHLARAHALRLAGDEEASAAELELSDDDALGWDDDGLMAWYTEERARVMPAAPVLDEDDGSL